MRFSPTPWFIAGIAFVVLGISRGMHTSFGVFNVALLDTFGWSRGATAGSRREMASAPDPILV